MSERGTEAEKGPSFHAGRMKTVRQGSSTNERGLGERKGEDVSKNDATAYDT